MNGVTIVTNDSSCASFGACELQQRPDPIYYLDTNTKSVTAPIQSPVNGTLKINPHG